MSIMTGTLGAREGILVVDTIAVAPNDTSFRMHVSKLYGVPHLGAIFATRGAAVFTATMLTAINFRPLRDFDALLDRVAPIVRAAYEGATPLLDEHGMSHQVEGMMMGWSAALGRVVGRFFNNRPGGSDLLYNSDLGYSPDFEIAAMPDGDFMVPGVFADELDAWRRQWGRSKDPKAKFTAAAKAQRANIDRTCEPGWVGGRLIMASVARHALEVRTIYEWPDGLAMPPDVIEDAGTDHRVAA